MSGLGSKVCAQLLSLAFALCMLYVGYWTICHKSQFVLDNMSQKGAICTKIIWTICHNFFYYLDNLSHFYFGQFVTSHICHNCILDDLSQVIFVLDDICLKKKNSDLG